METLSLGVGDDTGMYDELLPDEGVETGEIRIKLEPVVTDELAGKVE